MFQAMIHIERYVSPKILDAHGPKGVVMNIYGKLLCGDIFDRKCNGINGTIFRVKTAK